MMSHNYARKRLKTMIAETSMKMEVTMDDESKAEFDKDLRVLQHCYELVNDQFTHFDVARWSVADIEGVMDNLNIKTNDSEVFVENVIDFLSSNFDANYGVNWGTIEDAVYEIAERENCL